MEKLDIDMKTITTILTVAVFLFIIYKRKVKKKKEADSTASSESVKTVSLSDGAFPVSLGCGNENTRYEVMVFDMQNFPINDSLFESCIERKLNLKSMELQSKGYPYRFDFITIATSILVLVTYEVI